MKQYLDRLVSSFSSTAVALMAGAAVIAVEIPILFVHVFSRWGENTPGWTLLPYLVLPLFAYMKAAIAIEKGQALRTPKQTVLVHSIVGAAYLYLAGVPANWGEGIGPNGYVILTAATWVIGHSFFLFVFDSPQPKAHNPSARS